MKLARLITSARGPVAKNFMQIPPREGASRQMGEIRAKFIYLYYYDY